MSASLSWLDNVTILPPSLPLMRLVELAGYLDTYLRVADVPDAPAALNGLQLANAGDVTRVAAAVDLCEATVRMAAEQGSDLLLVHHGLFWGGLKPFTGPAYRRVAGLDTYITGEGAHHTFFDAEELGLNVFYAGHYATETLGVKALAEHLSAKFGLPWTFLDHPTGL